MKDKRLAVFLLHAATVGRSGRSACRREARGLSRAPEGKGLREVKRYVRDNGAPLSSDIIDLSELRPWHY